MPSDPIDLRVGDYYEDCACHPCLCISVDEDEGEVEVCGISLIDGSYPRSSSLKHCGVRKLTFAEALHWKFWGPIDVLLDEKKRWWHPHCTGYDPLVAACCLSNKQEPVP